MQNDQFEQSEAQLTEGSGRRVAWRAFAIFGTAYVLLLAVWNGMDIALVGLGARLWPQAAETTWFLLAANALSLYGIALPIFCLVLKALPASAPEQHRMGGGRFMICVLMCFALMIAGNVAGMIVTGLIQLATGAETINTAYDLLTSGENLAVLLISVGVLAPIFEELICRRIMINRLRCYGQKTALVVSSLAFAGLHGNLSQFFYAFALGMFFGFLYLRTGRLRYSIALHMTINIAATVVSALAAPLLDFADVGAQELLSIGLPALLQMMAAFLLVMLEYGCALAGLVLLILRRDSFVLPGGEEHPIPRGERLRTIVLNPGMLLAAAAAIALFAAGYIV